MVCNVVLSWDHWLVWYGKFIENFSCVWIKFCKLKTKAHPAPQTSILTDITKLFWCSRITNWHHCRGRLWFQHSGHLFSPDSHLKASQWHRRWFGCRGRWLLCKHRSVSCLVLRGAPEGAMSWTQKPSVIGSSRPACVHQVFLSTMPLFFKAGSKWCMILEMFALMLLLVFKNKWSPVCPGPTGHQTEPLSGPPGTAEGCSIQSESKWTTLLLLV